MSSTSGTEMKKESIITKYQESAAVFENLHKIFLEEDAEILLLYYDICIARIAELISIETNDYLTNYLENILAQIKWQQERMRTVCTSGVSTENKVAKSLQQQENTTVQQKGKLKDSNFDYRQEVIRSTLRQVTGNGLKDIIGLENVKLLLKNTILQPLKFPQLFTGGRKPWNQILLYGPPGTGKSKIAAALAIEAKAQLYSISSADLLSSYIGESEKMIKHLFEFTRMNKDRCLVFIDEIDSICRKRNDKEADHSRRTSRIEIIKSNCQGIGLDMDSEDWEAISQKTNGYSGSDLINLTSFALQEPLSDLETSQTWILHNGKWIPCASNTPKCIKIPLSEIPSEKVGVRDVMLKDFIKAIEIVPKTLSDIELNRYNDFSRIK